MSTYPPSIALSCALKRLPDSWRDGYSIIQQVEHAFSFGYNDPLFGGKAQLVSLAIKTSYWRQEGEGHGNRAAKREAMIEMNQWLNDLEHQQGQDPDSFVRQYAKEKNLNYHDL